MSLNNIADGVADLLNKSTLDNKAQEAKFAEWIDGMSEEQIAELLKKVNPYGTVSDAKIGEEETVSFSYTNMRMEFMKRLIATSMIGFMMRMLKEYKVPDEVPPVEPEDYLKNPSLCDTPLTITDPAARKKYEEMRATMPERIQIYNFLKHIFQFDPDRHVTAALQTNTEDSSRAVPKSETIGRILRERKNTVRSTELRKAYEAKYEDMSREPHTELERAAYTLIPPLDTFSRFDRYMEEYYEELLDTVHTIYGARPDVDIAVAVYDKHPTKEAAKLFKERNMSKVIAPITNIQVNRWALLGPYRENRERVDFYNKHTEVLKEMVDQREKDSHIAADIMKKRIRIKKQKNVEEVGPDDKAFLQYLKKNKPAIAKMGAEYAGTADLKDEDDDPNTVEVNVVGISDGGRSMNITKIYNPIEAPAVGEEKKSN
jgi:hypothetical protein